MPRLLACTTTCTRSYLNKTTDEALEVAKFYSKLVNWVEINTNYDSGSRAATLLKVYVIAYANGIQCPLPTLLENQREFM